jgi:hypothetical protein
MANIKILTGLAGHSFAHSPGDVLAVGQDVDAAEAARWVKAGYAEPSDAPRGLWLQPSEHVPNETAKKVRRRVERAVKNAVRKVAAPKASAAAAAKTDKTGAAGK